jgi:hypothetical protein
VAGSLPFCFDFDRGSRIELIRIGLFTKSVINCYNYNANYNSERIPRSDSIELAEVLSERSVDYVLAGLQGASIPKQTSFFEKGQIPCNTTLKPLFAGQT